MSTGQGGGGVGISNPYWGWPTRLASWGPTTAGSFSVTIPAPGNYDWIFLGADWTATQASPVQCWTWIALDSGNYIYWDSQSIGEGNGVRWSWRGALRIPSGFTFTIAGNAASSVVWGGCAWGVINDWQGEP